MHVIYYILYFQYYIFYVIYFIYPRQNLWAIQYPSAKGHHKREKEISANSFNEFRKGWEEQRGKHMGKTCRQHDCLALVFFWKGLD